MSFEIFNDIFYETPSLTFHGVYYGGVNKRNLYVFRSVRNEDGIHGIMSRSEA